MTKETIQIVDNSRDREYFTIVPNYILNHSTESEQALYLQMKRFAGEKGVCFATTETIARQLRCERKKVMKNIGLLLKRGWIKKVGTIAGKTHPINAYGIVDLWQLNAEYYREKICAKKGHISKEEQRYEPKGDTRYEPKKDIEEEPIEEDTSLLRKEGGETSSPQARLRVLVGDSDDTLLHKNRQDIKIIAAYADAKGVEFENKQQRTTFIRRNLRAAGLLLGYPQKKIELWCRILAMLPDLPKWTLETVGKYIDDDPIEIIERNLKNDAIDVLENLAEEGYLTKVVTKKPHSVETEVKYATSSE